MNIGVDIGGVLIGKRPGKTPNQLFDVPNSYSQLESLSQNNTLYIISYCGEKTAQRSYEALDPHNLFWSQYYVGHKSLKSSVVKYLDCDVMIDDNEHILNNIKNDNPTVTTILFQRYNKQKKRNHRLHHLVEDWDQVVEILVKVKVKRDTQQERKDPEGTAYFISS